MQSAVLYLEDKHIASVGETLFAILRYEECCGKDSWQHRIIVDKSPRPLGTRS